MFVQLEDGQVKSYPYTLAMFKQENKATSFPSSVSDELLAGYDVFRVVELEKPEFNSLTQNCILDATPRLEGGQWVVGHTIEDKPLAEAEHAVRAQRSSLLQGSDWVVIMHTEKGTNIPAEWELYRQALRDIPDQQGFPYQVVWPVAPGSQQKS